MFINICFFSSLRSCFSFALFYTLNFPPTWNRRDTCGKEKTLNGKTHFFEFKFRANIRRNEKRYWMSINEARWEAWIGWFCDCGRVVPRVYVCLQIFCLVGKWRDDIMEIEVHGKRYLAPLTSLPLAHFRDNVPCGQNIYCWGGCGFWFVRTLEDRSSRKYNTAGNLQVCWISLYVLL